MGDNPYSIIFGQEPEQMISRLSDTATIMEAFQKEKPSQNSYLITGVRGSGKTVFMTELANRFKKLKDWIVVELSSEGDILLDLAAELSSEAGLAKIFQNAEINLSFWGFGLKVKNEVPITSIKVALTKMLESLRDHGKRILITIDEVIANNSMRAFASNFQIFSRNKLPVFLLMTGLFENIRELQNEKNLTFLYRAPRIELKALSKRGIADNYREIFHLERDSAFEMADLTRGYSFAFQVLGYLTWEKSGDYHAVQSDYRRQIEDNVYDKIWSQLSPKDRLVCHAIANTPSGKVQEIRNYLNMETNAFNPYRKRLIEKGLVDGDERGYVRFTLPFFEDYVLENYYE